jgi:hypothetical protein
MGYFLASAIGPENPSGGLLVLLHGARSERDFSRVKGRSISVSSNLLFPLILFIF